jgi:DEAD/DEAH box helicase domain-containing protein
MAVSDAHHYHGLAASHLSGLFTRINRLIGSEAPLCLSATMASVASGAEGLSRIFGLDWRAILVDDTPRNELAAALWRVGGDRLRETLMLARGFHASGASVQILCSALEGRLLDSMLGSDETEIVTGPVALPSDVQIVVDAAEAPERISEALASSTELVVLLVGDEPAGRSMARVAEADPESLPLLDPRPPELAVAPVNAHVLAQHVLCTASEVPLSDGEAEDWRLSLLVERLAAQGRLQRLPGPDARWVPSVGVDPYTALDLLAVGTALVWISDDAGNLLGAGDPAAFDRWGFPDAVLPMLRGGLRVIDRRLDSDEQTLRLSVRSTDSQRRTIPLRRCTVRVRNQQEERSFRGATLGLGRVSFEEDIHGFRELVKGRAPADRALTPALSTAWNAPAVWIDLPAALSVKDQLIGWSLALALPLRVVCAASDCVPAYDAQDRRLYLVDAQPGGNGLALWLFDNLEELLPLAYDIALDCRSDPLLEPPARIDMDWLLSLLGGAIGPLPEQTPPAPAPPLEPPNRRVPVQPAVREEPAAAAPSRPMARKEPPARSEPTAPRRDRREEATPPSSQNQRAASRSGTAARQSGREEAKPGASRRPVRGRDVPEQPGSTRSAGTSRDRPARPPQRDAPAPPRQEPPPPPADPVPLPDAASMVERLRKMREKRERRERAAPARPNPAKPGEPHFNAGQQVFCMPYGYGEVRQSRFDQDREILTVAFPDYGELTIDPQVNAVRVINPPVDASEDDAG